MSIIIRADTVPVDLRTLAQQLRGLGFKTSHSTLYRAARDGYLRCAKTPLWRSSVADYLEMIGTRIPRQGADTAIPRNGA